MNSVSSSIVSALGAGSGVDMTKLATDLANAQFQLRTDRLVEKSETLERQISSASSLKNSLSLLAGALGDRVRSGDLAVTPKISNSLVAQASTPVGTIGTGTYSLEVETLAKSQAVSSPAFADSTSVVGEGTLTFRFGTTSGSSFTEDASHAAVTVDIAAGSTLGDIAKAINAKNAGLNAYVAQTAQGAQLVVKGSEGANNGFIIEGTNTGAGGGITLPGTSAEGLELLAWDPGSGDDPARLLEQSGDARFKLDGLSMTSASNKVGTVAPGLSLALTGTNPGAPATISFPSPVANISTAMQDLVGAINEIIGDLNSATDPLSGDLSRDPGARALKRKLSGLAGIEVMPNAAEGAPRTLSDLGLAIERDGTFRLDTARLEATLARDPSGVAAMFTNGLYGVYSTIDKIARSASTTGDPGSLGGSIARYQKESTKVSNATADLAEQQERLRANMVARFAKADARVSASQSTLSFLQSQIDAWNAQRN